MIYAEKLASLAPWRLADRPRFLALGLTRWEERRKSYSQMNENCYRLTVLTEYEDGDSEVGSVYMADHTISGVDERFAKLEPDLTVVAIELMGGFVSEL